MSTIRCLSIQLVSFILTLAGLLLAVAGVAPYVPIRQAARVDPAARLRTD